MEDIMRNAALLGTRLVLGSYLAVHGAQKLFGVLGGPGLDKAGAGFDRIGLSPGKQMAAIAGITELPLTNLAAATALLAAGPGRFRVGPSLPRPIAAVAGAGAALIAAGLLTKMLTAKPPAPAGTDSEPESAGEPSPEPSTAR
jgi:putative oxidoreductase